MKATEATMILSRIASSYPSNSPEWLALTVTQGVVLGLHMSGGLKDSGATDANGHFVIPSTILTRINEGDQAMDLTADPTAPPGEVQETHFYCTCEHYTGERGGKCTVCRGEIPDQ